MGEMDDEYHSGTWRTYRTLITMILTKALTTTSYRISLSLKQPILVQNKAYYQTQLISCFYCDYFNLNNINKLFKLQQNLIFFWIFKTGNQDSNPSYN